MTQPRVLNSEKVIAAIEHLKMFAVYLPDAQSKQILRGGCDGLRECILNGCFDAEDYLAFDIPTLSDLREQAALMSYDDARDYLASVILDNP